VEAFTVHLDQSHDIVPFFLRDDLMFAIASMKESMIAQGSLYGTLQMGNQKD